MYKYTCPICNVDFEVKNKGRKYCSIKCTAEGNKRVPLIESKLCGACKIEKPVENFWKRKDSVNGFHWQCIECEKKKRQTPEFKEKYRVYARRKKRLKSPYGLNPDFEGTYKGGTKRNPDTRTMRKGYVLMYRPGHPNAQKSTKGHKGRMFEHTFVMSEHLGRPLRKDESVHHKNGIRDDNRVENLELWHKGQPKCQRVSDKITWAKDLLEEYGYKVTKE